MVDQTTSVLLPSVLGPPTPQANLSLLDASYHHPGEIRRTHRVSGRVGCASQIGGATY